MSKTRFTLLALLGLAAGGLLAWFLLQASLAGRPHTFHGTLIEPPVPAPGFSLATHNGQRLSLADLQGKLVLLYFGYTFCPDVCPATLAELAQARRRLGDQADRVQVLMVTVDPERDTPQALGDYLTHFDPTFVGLTGSTEELAALDQAYGIYAAHDEGDADTGYLVEHTSSVMVIDAAGNWRLLFSFGTPAAEIADDLAYLLRQGGGGG